MDIFGNAWLNHPDRIKEGFKILNQDDLCVICGDISWSMSLEEGLEDFRFISELPGKKIILKGNHDYWWNTVSKMNDFFSKNGLQGIDFLNNNCYIYKGTAICGTRGWFYDDKMNADQNKKVFARETLRLKASLEAAGNDCEKICFFHYPPRYNKFESHDIISLMNEHNVKKCVYGHLHGEGHRYAVSGLTEGIDYEPVPADLINFTPKKIN